MSNLNKIAEEIEREFPDTDFFMSCYEYDIDQETMRFLLSAKNDGLYYRALAIFQRLYLTSPNKSFNILDLGTYRGGSLVALSLTKGINTILSVDIDLSNIQNLKSLESIGEIRRVSEDFIATEDYSKYDFIFVDIDHNGDNEKVIHGRLLESNYKGIVFYDDVSLNEEMKKFWDSIEQEKLITDWHFSGFGLVKYV